MNKSVLVAAVVVVAAGRGFGPAESAALKGRPAPDPTVTKADVTKWMTDLSNWGRWGKDDQRGTLNLITPEKRKQALKIVRDGIAVSLAHSVDKERAPDAPRPLQQAMTLDAGGHAMDLYTIWYHGSVITHIDSLCHYSFENRLYNGFDRSKIAEGVGCPQNGVENQKSGIMTRGILVDMPRLKNVAYLEPGTAIYPSDLEAWEKFAGVKIGSGDAVFIRTGRWAQRAQKGAWNVAASAAGEHAALMPWLKSRDIALLGNDAVNDVQPSGIDGVGRPIHQLAIVAMGLPLIDVMDLEAVADQAAKLRRWEFLVTAAPVPVLGGTGFPLNPIATF